MGRIAQRVHRAAVPAQARSGLCSNAQGMTSEFSSDISHGGWILLAEGECEALDRPDQESRMGPRSRAPGKQEFEFFGPYLGPIGIPIATISTCFALYHLCGAHGCASLLDWSLPPAALGPWLTWQAVAVYLGWLAFQIALHLLLPGQRVQGVPLPNGQRLTYKFTGKGRLRLRMGFVCGGGGGGKGRGVLGREEVFGAWERAEQSTIRPCERCQ